MNENAKANMAEEIMDGERSGKVTVMKVFSLLAPSTAAVYSRLGFKFAQKADTTLTIIA